MPMDWTRDEIILAYDLLRDNEWQEVRRSDPRAAELSQVLNAAPIIPRDERDDKFRSPNSVQRKLADLRTRRPGYTGAPTRGGRLDLEVIEQFYGKDRELAQIAAEIRRTISGGLVSTIPDDEIDAEEIGADEGRLLVTVHLRRERNQKLRAEKIATVKCAGGIIACDVCGFDFGRTYGELGSDFIEVHHVLPLHASGPTKTRLKDLALLCSNCHRMIHRARPWLTPEQLRSRVNPQA